jgi:hypothetical protein
VAGQPVGFVRSGLVETVRLGVERVTVFVIVAVSA